MRSYESILLVKGARRVGNATDNDGYQATRATVH
jgi:hypothetical protein